MHYPKNCLKRFRMFCSKFRMNNLHRLLVLLPVVVVGWPATPVLIHEILLQTFCCSRSNERKKAKILICLTYVPDMTYAFISFGTFGWCIMSPNCPSWNESKSKVTCYTLSYSHFYILILNLFMCYCDKQ